MIVKNAHLILFCLSVLIFISCGEKSVNNTVYTLDVDVSPLEGGRVTEVSGQYQKGEEVTLTATPENQWLFDDWSGDVMTTSNPLTIIMDSEKSITANFVRPSIYLADNGITIMCPDAAPGEVGVVNGVEYEVVNEDLLRQKDIERNDFSRFCISGITNLGGLFEGSQFNQNISNWDVSSVVDMSAMFKNSAFNQNINNWDVSAVTSMSSMFESTMFESVDNVFNQPIGSWDVSSVTDMSYMFFNNIVFNQPLGDWNVNNVTDMSGMFWAEEGSFNQPIGSWDVSSVTTMENMFRANGFNQPIGGWDVSSVTNMEEMFWYSQFNQPIGEWDVSLVTNMDGMFQNTPFNQPIDTWCVDQFTNGEPSFFSVGSPLTEENKPVWGTCPANKK